MKLILLGLNARKHKGYAAKVDDEDYEGLMKYRWYAQYNPGIRGFYAASSFVPMHRLVMRAPRGMDVDHINHDTLDNRKCNLRLCSRKQNLGNQRFQKGRSSAYKGVSWYKRRGVWNAQIKKGYKRVHLGDFSNEEDAARAYDTAAREYFGEFAFLNFPFGQ